MDRVGPYDIHEELGRGGAGVVYRAEHRTTGDPAAVKVLRRQEHRDRQSLQREFDVLCALAHPGIVGILGQGTTDDGRRWLATELLSGTTLRQALGPRAAIAAETFDFAEPSAVPDPTPWQAHPEVLRAIGQLLHAVVWLHGEGIVHRDLKPENVMLVDGQAVLIDFGMATLTQARDAPERLVGGTRGYMAPEQARGEAVDGRADLFALGCMLHEALTGRMPTSPPEDLGELGHLVAPLLAERPEDRVLHLEALARALGAPRVGPPPRHVLHRPPLVGRTEAQSATAEAMAAGHGALLVTGPSGVGRTRVAMEGFGAARRRGWPAFVGHRAGPLEAFRTLVRKAWSTEGRVPSASHHQAALAALAEHLGLPVDDTPGTLEAEAGRVRLVEGVVAAAQVVAADGPIAIVLDDLHDAHPLTVEAAWRLCQSIRDSNPDVVLVMTWDTEVAPAPRALQSECRTLALTPLTASELEALSHYAAPGARPSTREVAVRLAEGLPLLCMEGLRIPKGGTLAQSYEDRALVRLGMLPEASRELVELAAVAGDGLALDHLEAATMRSAREVSIALHEARLEGFLESDDHWVRCPHRRLRDAVAREIPPPRRARLHRAAAVNARGASRAHHLQQAGDVVAARDAWIEEVELAGLDPLRRQHALEALAASWSPPRPAWIELALAELHLERGQREAAVQRAATALEASPPRRAAAHLLIARASPRTSDEVAHHLGQAKALADDHGLVELSIEVRLKEQQIARGLGKPLVSILEALADVRTRIPTDRTALLLQEAFERGSALAVYDRSEEASKVLDDAQRWLDDAPVSLRCRLLGNLGAARWQNNDLDGALRATMANIRTAAQHGVLTSLRSAMANLALLTGAMGDEEAADRLVGGALQLRTDDDEGVIGLLIRKLDLFLSYGDFPTAMPHLSTLLAEAERRSNRLHGYELRHRLACCHIVDGELTEALAVLGPVPDGFRDDPEELRHVVELLQGRHAPLPDSTVATLVLGLCSTDPRHRVHARDVFTRAFEAKPLRSFRHWALHFGAPSMPTPAEPPPLPPEIDALCFPLEDALPRALKRLERRS